MAGGIVMGKRRDYENFPISLALCTFAGMVMMGVFAKKLDPAKTKSNWIEQITNAVAQGCLLSFL